MTMDHLPAPDEQETNRSQVATTKHFRNQCERASRTTLIRTMKGEEVANNQSAALTAVATRPDRNRPGRLHAAVRDAPIAFLYLRVSTKEQARTGGGEEGYSIPSQRKAGYAKAQQLNATIVEEYVDAGESAKTARRPDLQRMLRDVKTVRPDYVIVHKIDRLARNREDDIAINLLLRKHGVRLISCCENIDDTPSGRLLYGLMAEIAQFYAGNLAQEVLKGLVRKAEEGGTPFRAPLGYCNRRELRDGVNYSWVELDNERAEIIGWCFERYATGEWTVINLTLAARQKGLTSRPTASKPAKPISLNGMHHILQNPYYMGLVPYQGIHYEGKHPKLVEPDVWLAVQDILAAHNHTGEKDRKHNHYLRGSIFCSTCGARLVYSRNKGNGGTYEYFMCLKQKLKTNNCRRSAIRLERIENGVTALYARFQISEARVEHIRTGVLKEMASQQDEAETSVKRAERRRVELQDQRRKLLQAHYAGAIPQDLLASEMQRLTRGLADAEAEIANANVTLGDVQTTLNQALQAAANCQAQYEEAPGHIRRLINQGFFKRLFIGPEGGVERYELTEPFATLLTDGRLVATDASTLAQDAPDTTSLSDQETIASSEQAAVCDALEHANDASRQAWRAGVLEQTFSLVGDSHEAQDDLFGLGLKENYVVEVPGIEPGSSVVLPGLLRAQSVSSLLGPTGLTD